VNKYKKKIIDYFRSMNLFVTEFINPIHKNIQLPSQPKETEIGNKEYKRRIMFDKNISKMIEKRRTQMLYRLYEGYGTAYYFIGVEDNGEPQGITVQEMSTTFQNLKKISDGLQNTKWHSVEIYKGLHKNTYTAIVKIEIMDDTDITFSIY